MISVLYYGHLCMKLFLGISNFLEEISSLSHYTEEISNLSHFIVFLYFFVLIAEEGFLMSPAILWNSAFKWVYLSFSPSPFSSLLFIAFTVRPPLTTILPFFFLEMVLITASYTMS